MYLVAHQKSRSINKNGQVWKRTSPGVTATLSAEQDTCVDPFVSRQDDHTHKQATALIKSGTHPRRRQTTTNPTTTQGYTTTDAFGTDGDDTAHAAIPYYDYPHFFQALGGFPENGSATPDVVDLIFIDYIQPDILQYLGDAYSEDDISYYIDETFSTRTYLPLYVQASEAFQRDKENCTIY
jgi:hypothetical protein